MKSPFAHLAILLSLALPATAGAADFANYQPADVVLGQQNFVSGAASAQANGFIGASGVAMDPTTGKVFVAQQGANRVVRFSSAAAAQNGSNPEAVFGQAGFASVLPNQGGAAAANTLSGPGDVFVDAAGTLWVCDFGNNRVLKYALASLVGPTNPSADVVLGQPDFATTTSGLNASKMNAPYGLTVDSSGVLWVADNANNRVLRFDAAAGKASGSAADGVLGQLLFTTNIAATTSISMSGPAGVTFDSSGRLWVADTSNNRVLRFDAAAGKANGAAADGVLGQADFITGTSGLTAASLSFPYGLYSDASGNLWVGEYGNRRGIRFNAAATLAAGSSASLVLGQPNFTTNTPAVTARGGGGIVHIAAGPGGTLFVADYTNNRALRYTPGTIPKAPLISRIGSARRTTTSSKLVVSGLSGDDDGAVVVVKGNVNSGTYTNAKGTSPWHYTARRLKFGINHIKVRAIDNDGLKSEFARVTITRRHATP